MERASQGAKFIVFLDKIEYIIPLNKFMVDENVQRIRQRIVSACARSNRPPEEVTLVAVTKTFSSRSIRDALASGVRDIGENYIQELTGKYAELSREDIRWHFIGHLQSNKVKHIVPWIHCIHSVDSVALGKEIAKHAETSGRTLSVLIEVNTSGESTKFGVSPDSAHSLAQQLNELKNISVDGLMTIGPFLPDPEASRPSFRRLANLKSDIAKAGIPMRHLSMGMTNDFEVAIEEGATMVRIGTAIFGKRAKKV